MRAVLYVAVLGFMACTPVRQDGKIVGFQAEGEQRLSSVDPQITNYRLELHRPPSQQKYCLIGLHHTILRSGGGVDAGTNQEGVPIPVPMIRLQKNSLDADGGDQWVDWAAEAPAPGTRLDLWERFWDGTDAEHVENFRVLLDPGTGPSNSELYTYQFDFIIQLARDADDYPPQAVTMEELVDGGWVDAGADMAEWHPRENWCNGPPTPTGTCYPWYP